MPVSQPRSRKKSHRSVDNPAGTKRIKRFVKDARGENIAYRRDLVWAESGGALQCGFGRSYRKARRR